MRALAVLGLLAAIAVLTVGAGQTQRADPDAVFGGLATWVDIYDGPVYASPETTASRIAARGVRTVFAETSNDRATVDVVKPAQLGRFVDALHARGIAVVAWYLPGFVQPALDLRRTLAMLRFRTPGDGGFDAVALDVESTRQRNAGLRNRRLLALGGRLRAEAAETPVAAITLPPRMLERRPTMWPRFPWVELAGLTDAFVPMAYTSSFRGYEATYGYVARSLAQLRALTGQPDLRIHAAGGVANRLTADELQAFADAVSDDGRSIGWSLYDFQTTGSPGWRALATVDPPSR